MQTVKVLTCVNAIANLRYLKNSVENVITTQEQATFRLRIIH